MIFEGEKGHWARSLVYKKLIKILVGKQRKDAK